MREIHNSKKRMPVILTPENEIAWLKNEPLTDFVKVNIELNAVKIDVANSTGLLF